MKYETEIKYVLEYFSDRNITLDRLTNGGITIGYLYFDSEEIFSEDFKNFKINGNVLRIRFSQKLNNNLFKYIWYYHDREISVDYRYGEYTYIKKKIKEMGLYDVPYKQWDLSARMELKILS